MNNFKIYLIGILGFLIMLTSMLFTSCQEAGETSKTLSGTEQNLPAELKGLKVYWVSTGRGNGVNVAILNDKINSVTYSVGKSQQTTVILNSEKGNVITVKQILMENDSLIVCRK